MSKKVMQKIVSIEKQELSAEKVELALIDELKSLVQQSSKDEARANLMISGIGTQVRATIRDIDTAISTINKIESAVTSFEQSSKELGINPNEIKEYKDAKLSIRLKDEYIRLKKFARSVRKRFES